MDANLFLAAQMKQKAFEHLLTVSLSDESVLISRFYYSNSGAKKRNQGMLIGVGG